MRLVRAAPVSRLVTPQSGEYVDVGMLQGFYNGFTTLTPTTNGFYAWPFVVDQTLVVSELHLEVAIAEAGKSMRLGIYTDAAGRPAVRLADSGNLSMATTGDKSAVIAGNLVLPPGTYWSTLITDATGTAQLRAIQGAGRVIMPVANATPALTATSYIGWDGTHTFGALPATFPVANRSNAAMARIEVRIA